MGKPNELIIKHIVFAQSAHGHAHTVARHSVKLCLRSVIFFKILQELFGSGGEFKKLRFALEACPRRQNFFFAWLIFEGYKHGRRMPVGNGYSKTLRRDRGGAGGFNFAVIPYIGGEEEKSEKEPLKIWGSLENGEIVSANAPAITAQCLRVPVSDGHTAAVFVKFDKKPTKEEILSAWNTFAGEPQKLALPSAPKQFIRYFEEDNRPQAKLDRMEGNGMSVTAGRLREDNVYDYKFIGLSHNTLRGAAGGAVLLAELLASKGYMD